MTENGSNPSMPRLRMYPRDPTQTFQSHFDPVPKCYFSPVEKAEKWQRISANCVSAVIWKTCEYL